MEESHSKEERETSDAPLDSVDHGRLARLVTSSPAPGIEAEPQQMPPEIHITAMNLPTAPSPQSFEQPRIAYAAPPAPASASPKKGFSSALIIIPVAGLLLILAGALFLYFFTSNKSTNQPAPKGKNDNSAVPARTAMVAIDGGTFQMGRSDGAVQEGPPHPVTVEAFAIDRTEVTNAEYAQFVQETGHAAPGHFINGKPASGQEQWPVTNVSLDDAKAFAEWRSKRDGVTYRLPTEEEWEFAARDGGKGSIFPWGDRWEADRANVDGTSLKPVGSSPADRTRSGVMDMIGNVYEWTSSKAAYYPGSKGQLRPDNEGWVVVRGGAYITDSSKKQVSATYRDWIPPQTVNAGLGFRLVRAE